MRLLIKRTSLKPWNLCRIRFVEPMKRIKNTLGTGTRVWLQLVSKTITVGLGKPTLENKKIIPESWIVGHLPVYLSIGRDSLCLTDLTVEELELLREALNKACDAAHPVCELLDEAAYEVLERGGDLELVPNRVLRGRPPSYSRDIKTKFKIEDLPEEDRPTVINYLDQLRG